MDAPPDPKAVDLTVRKMASAATGHAPDPRVAGFALSYLNAFGYLRDELRAWGDISLSDIVAAIGRFQDAFGLRQTRVLDVQTVRAMEARRCGCRDDALAALHAATAPLRRAWATRPMTYRVVSAPPGISAGEMEGVVRLAASRWTRYLKVAIAEAGEHAVADVTVRAESGRQSNFDGPGGVLVHVAATGSATEPVRVTFDADERWALASADRGTAIDVVACHAFGHVFGLDHTTGARSVMTPEHNPCLTGPQPDDVRRLLELYKPA